MMVHKMKTQSNSKKARHADDQAITVDGWQYYTAVEHDDDDCRKIAHYLIHERTGETQEINWTPYERMTAPDIKRMIDMGFPKYPDLKNANGHQIWAPWRSETAELAWYRRNAAGYGLTPNHVPPGKAAPRFLNLRTGGNLPKDHGLGFPIIFIAALVVLTILSIFTYG